MTAMSNHPLWIRIPAGLARPLPRTVAAGIVLVLLLAPGLWVRHMQREKLATEAADWFAASVEHLPYVRGMSSAQHAELYEKIHAQAEHNIPLLRLGALAAGPGAAAGLWLVLALLYPAFAGGSGRERARVFEPVVRCRGRAEPWALLIVVVLAFACQWPYERLSFNFDEANSSLYALHGAFGWIDTRMGWTNHFGGLLLVRISTYLLGATQFAARLPAMICSSIGMGVLFAWVRRYHGPLAAALACGILLVFPLWGETACQARGYGLAMLGFGLLIYLAYRMLEAPGGSGGGAATWAMLACAIASCSAHFFLFFGVLAVWVVFVIEGVWRRDARCGAAAFWIGVGMTIAFLAYVPGLPATFSQRSELAHRNLWPEIGQRFVQEFGWRAPWTGVALAICGVSVLAVGIGLRMVERKERRLLALVLGLSLLSPIVLKAGFIYPRYYLFLCPILTLLAALPAAWVLGRVFAAPVAQVGVAAVVLVSIWAATRPWKTQAVDDIRQAARILLAERREGRICYVDTNMQGIDFYAPGQFRFASFRKGIPADATVLAFSGRPENPPPGFGHLVDVPAQDVTISIYRKE